MRFSTLLLNSICLVLLLICCKQTKESKPFWDEESATYYIPLDSLSFHFGALAEEWIILDPDSLPANMGLCAIDPNRNICLMLIAPSAKSFKELSKTDKYNIIQEICYQQNPDIHHSQPYISDSSSFTKFQQEIHIDSSEPAERTEITFTGYIFDRNNQTKVLVSTIPKELLDSLGEKALLGSIYSGISATRLHYSLNK